MARLHFKVSKDGRLDEFLRYHLESEVISVCGKCEGNFSASKIRRLIISGMVSVDVRVVRRPAFFLRAPSDVAVVFFPEAFFYEKKTNDAPFRMSEERILYEDANIMVVDKAAKIPTDSSGTVPSRVTLSSALNEFLRDTRSNSSPIFPVHRLDRETSGIVVFAKTKEAASFYHKVFFERRIEKFYRAFCEVKDVTISVGKSLVIENFLVRSSSKSARAEWGVAEKTEGNKNVGVYAKTDITVLERKEKKNRVFLEVEARPFTGRTHQIRVHLSHIGLPIVGDTLYGAAPFHRVLLHAYKIVLPQMEKSDLLCITSLFPPDFSP